MGEIDKQCHVTIEEIVVKVGISNRPCVIISDVDLTVPWGNYWSADRGTGKLVSYFLVVYWQGVIE